MGAGASVVFRLHATAEVLGRSDDRNPHYYYGTGKLTPKRAFWTTTEGKTAKRNLSVLQGDVLGVLHHDVVVFGGPLAKAPRPEGGGRQRASRAARVRRAAPPRAAGTRGS